MRAESFIKNLFCAKEVEPTTLPVWPGVSRPPYKNSSIQTVRTSKAVRQ